MHNSVVFSGLLCVCVCVSACISHPYETSSGINTELVSTNSKAQFILLHYICVCVWRKGKLVTYTAHCYVLR